MRTPGTNGPATNDHHVLAPHPTGDLRPNRLAHPLAERRRSGQPIIDLTESNPTRAGFEYPQDLLAPLASARGLIYAPEPFGLIEARRAVAADYARRGVVVDAERIVLTASTSDAYSLLFKLLAAPGDEVLVPRPSYPLFELLTTLDGLAARPYDLEYHGTWSIDIASIERAVGPRTRALLVVSPNNPTGSFVSRVEIDRLAAICGPRGIALIADEVFADYELEAGAAGTGCECSRATTCSCSALEDCRSRLGCRSSSSDGSRLQARTGSWPRRSSGSSWCATRICRSRRPCNWRRRAAGPGSAVRAQIASRIGGNYRRLKELAATWPSCRVLTAMGGWYAVVQVPTLRSEEELVLDLLTSDGVLAHPGYFFDFPRESYLIVSLLTPERPFVAGVERLLERAAFHAGICPFTDAS